ncbi:MAG: deoxyribose-phosphate aldolase [Oscillospiraceae bacterium]|nr:deoxyribose-phosphate aldolase [Oscillospiraceae bacterium]
MDFKTVLTHCDHTLLTPTATWGEIRQACDDALKFNCASVCIPPAYVAQAAEHVCDSIKICTVIGFPNGYETTRVKVFEAEDAVRNGADELDIVIHQGWVKDKRWEQLRSEIRSLKSASGGRILKVIVETCLLTEEEKKRLCEVVTLGGADYLKTSTGFSVAGAALEDVALFRQLLTTVKIKASGGIRTLEQAQAFLEAGADRLGASALVRLAKRAEVDSIHRMAAARLENR